MLEGGQDCATVDKHLDLEACQTIPAGGKEPLIEALDGARARRMKGVFGIVDADYWHFDNELPQRSDLIVLPVHDLEVMLLMSGALEDVMRTYASETKVTRLLRERHHKSVMDLLLESAGPAAALRRMNHVERLNLRFDGV